MTALHYKSHKKSDAIRTPNPNGQSCFFLRRRFSDYAPDAVNGLPLEVGFAAFITDNIAVEPSFGYALGLGDNESNTFGLNVGFSLYLNRQ